MTRSALAAAKPNIKTVSKTHFSSTPLGKLITAARGDYAVVAAGDYRSHKAIRKLVARLGLAIREARQDRRASDAMCRKARIKGWRFEVRIARFAIGHAKQLSRWASAAAYISLPPNGDASPATLADAIAYVEKRGGVRCLSDLYAGRKSALVPDGYTNGLFYRRYDDDLKEYYTPPYIFIALGCRFDLDPASPGPEFVPWIPASRHYTRNGLELPWGNSFVWLNPPYGNMAPWMKKFSAHGNGICLVPERTSTRWWQDCASRADLVLCVNRKIPFLKPTRQGLQGGLAFPIGSTLIAYGPQAVEALIHAEQAGLGMLLKPISAAEIFHDGEMTSEADTDAEAGTAMALPG